MWISTVKRAQNLCINPITIQHRREAQKIIELFHPPGQDDSVLLCLALFDTAAGGWRWWRWRRTIVWGLKNKPSWSCGNSKPWRKQPPSPLYPPSTTPLCSEDNVTLTVGVGTHPHTPLVRPPPQTHLGWVVGLGSAHVSTRSNFELVRHEYFRHLINFPVAVVVCWCYWTLVLEPGCITRLAWMDIPVRNPPPCFWLVKHGW